MTSYTYWEFFFFLSTGSPCCLYWLCFFSTSHRKLYWRYTTTTNYGGRQWG